MRVFVYGTLRPRGALHSSWARGTEIVAQGATAPGALYHVSPHKSYPVAKFDEEGTIIGDILDFDEEDWEEVRGMEVGAGYEVREIEAVADNVTYSCVAFQYRHDPRGPKITTGDYFDEC